MIERDYNRRPKINQVWSVYNASDEQQKEHLAAALLQNKETFLAEKYIASLNKSKQKYLPFTLHNLKF